MIHPLFARAAFGAAILFTPSLFAAPSDSARALRAAGAQSLEKKELDVAAERFGEAVKDSPDFVEAWVDLGNVELARGRFAEAERAFRAALKLQDGLPVAMYNLAYTLRKAARYPESVATYRRYLTLIPTDADAYFGLAGALESAERLSEAADAFDRYAELESRPDRAPWVGKAKDKAAELRARAKMKAAESRVPTGSQDTQTAAVTPIPRVSLTSEVGNDDAELKAALTTLRESRFEEAAGALERLQADNRGENILVIAGLASAYLATGRVDAARRNFEAALPLASGAARAAIHFGIAQAMRASGDAEGAMEVLNRLAEDAATPAALQPHIAALLR